jgi:hypothetical protein
MAAAAIAVRCLAKSLKSTHRIGWLVNEDNFERVMSLRNGSHLPTTQCACVEFEDFAKQRNGGGGHEKDQCGGPSHSIC